MSKELQYYRLSFRPELHTRTFMYSEPLKYNKCLKHPDRNSNGLSNDPGAPPYLGCGEGLDEELLARFPKVTQVVPISHRAKQHGITIKLDFLQGLGGDFWSERARDVAETLEPGRHQFIETRFVGEKLDREYTFYFFNCLNWVASDDLYDVSMRPLPDYLKESRLGNPETGYWDAISLKPHALPPLRLSAVAGSHILIEGSYSYHLKPKIWGNRATIVSAQFKRLAEERGLLGLRFYGQYPIAATSQASFEAAQ